MAGDISIADVLRLPVAERIQLVEDIWDSIASVPEAVPLTDAQRRELDRRIKAYHLDPRAGSPWSQVRKRIRAAK
jgi:putative addiction module component (TIGR02574 family)